MKQIQIRYRAEHQLITIRQTGTRVFSGKSGDVDSSVDGCLKRLAREIAGRCIALALAQINGDANLFVAMMLDGLDFPLAHVNALSESFGNFYLGRSRAALLGNGQQIIGNFF